MVYLSAVIQPGINRARCRVTSSVQLNMVLLRNATTCSVVSLRRNHKFMIVLPNKHYSRVHSTRSQTQRETRKSQLMQKRNVKQRCMFESPVEQNLLVCFYYSRQRAPDDRRLIIYSVLCILAKGRDLSRSANAVSAGYRKFSQLPLI